MGYETMLEGGGGRGPVNFPKKGPGLKAKLWSMKMAILGES
jgi:hypothetical protein